MLFPPRWFSLHLGTGSLPAISSGLLQPLGKTAPRHRLASRVELTADLPEHFRRATLQLIPTRSLASHFQGQRPLPQQELARQQGNLGLRTTMGTVRLTSRTSFTTRLYVLKKHSLSHLIR